MVDEYVAEKGITYDDIEYLEVYGDLGQSDATAVDIGSNYHFINESLLNLKVLNMRNADMLIIPQAAFEGNRSIHYITLPKYLRRISDSAFCNSELRNVNIYIPPHVEHVGYNAFAGTQLSGSIILSPASGYIYLGPSAFATPYILTVVIGNGVTQVSGGMFSGNPYNDEYFNAGLALLVLPSTLTAIDPPILYNTSIVVCHAVVPPALTDMVLYPDTVGSVIVPAASWLLYTDEGSDWRVFTICAGM